jgi:transposase
MAMFNQDTSQFTELRLDHQNGEAERFYRSLPEPALIGVESTGPLLWFETLLAKLGHQLWIGDSARIRSSEVRKQKTDQRDARLILDLLVTHRFPRIWVPSPAQRDFRQMLWHRHKLIGMRTQLRNQLHFLALSQQLCRKSRLFTRRGRSELQALSLAPWASRRRTELLALLDQLEPSITNLDRAILAQAQQHHDAARLMTHPGIGPVNALAFVLTVGPVERFRRSKQLVSYLGLNPRESSSGGRQRLGSISKQGNSMMRWLLVEAAHQAARHDLELRRDYLRLKIRRGSAVAKVAIARKLAVRMYWMLRTGADYAQLVRTQASPGGTLVNAPGSPFC